MSRTRFWIEGLAPAAILLSLVSTLAHAAGQNLTHQLVVGHGGIQAVRVAIPVLPPGADVNAASELLQTAGLSIGAIRCDPVSGAPGKVIRFLPASGKMLARGSAVDIYVGGHCTPLPGHVGTLVSHTHVIYRGTTTIRPSAPPRLPTPSGSSPPPQATQNCPDGSVVLAGAQCPALAQADVSSAPVPRASTAPGAVAAPAAQAPDAAAPLPGAAPAPDAKPGVGGFVAPGDMEVDNWHEVEFAVAADMVQLQVQVEGQDLAGQKAIYIAPVMRVTLLPNPDFDVQAKTSAVQTIGNDYASTWLWSVKPHKGGDEMLDALIEVGHINGNQFIAADSYTRHVPVKVKVGTWKSFLTALQNASTLGDALSTLFKSWGKTLIALTALVGAAGGLFVAVRKRGKSKDETGDAAPR